MKQNCILAIDEGTTNSKAVLVSENGTIVATGSTPVPISYPQPGWVEQDANKIWVATLNAIATCLEATPNAKIAGLGISNQRESILIWDRKSGEPIGPVVTWQCRRTAAVCETLKQSGHEPELIARTGLPLDPLFPPTKVAWLLKTHASGHSEADICVGTVDAWLIWKLSGGTVHSTDSSNAARTQLFNLAEGRWDSSLCDLFGVSMSMLPSVHDSSHVFATTQGVSVIPDGVPIGSAIGDSHAALFGHGAFDKGDGKITFGTGSSMMTTIPEFIVPPEGITTTIAWSLNGTSNFAFEGNILVSASILPWTAKLLGLKDVGELLDLAQTVDGALGVSLVPAHVGLGAPHWDSKARGLISGLTFSSDQAHLARAAAESLAFQVHDIYTIMSGAAKGIGRLYVDGGPSQNTFLMGLVADYLNQPVTPCKNSEASAIGAAYLAGLSTGVWPDLEAVYKLTTHDKEIIPSMSQEIRARNLANWNSAIARTITDIV